MATTINTTTTINSNAYLIFAVAWIVISAFSYGYHISALNGAQDVITCRSNRARIASLDTTPYRSSISFLNSCIAMSENLFGLLTASYTLGGFIGSIYASKLANSRGRKSTLLISSSLIGFGSILMYLSNLFATILIGRTIVGIGCGLNTVLVPIYLSEISPIHLRGSVGVLNQLAIVLGIFIAQLVSLPLSKPYLWRWIFIISAAFSALQLLTAPLMIESPTWAIEREAARRTKLDAGHPHDGDDLPRDDETARDDEAAERETLLNPSTTESSIHSHHQLSPRIVSKSDHMTLGQLLQDWKHDPALKLGLKILLITQVAQQLSGVNAVLYYSTSIMKSVLPTQAIYISLFITTVNVIMTFPPIFLVDRLGRKSLLLISSISMGITSFILGFSINYEIAQVSSLAIVLFVASFSVGLGPIPFVILSEVVPIHAVSAAGSLSLAVNWASSFLVGFLFLPLRNLLSSPDGYGDGNVFFAFTIVSGISSFLIATNYQPQS